MYADIFLNSLTYLILNYNEGNSLILYDNNT